MKPGSNCDIIVCDLSQKHKLTPFTRLEGQKLVDSKNLVSFEKRHSNIIELVSCEVHVVWCRCMTISLKTPRNFTSFSFENTMKTYFTVVL